MADREQLAAEHGPVWDENEFLVDFDIIGLAIPRLVVRRKSDGEKGSVAFQNSPRFYFGFVED